MSGKQKRPGEYLSHPASPDLLCYHSLTLLVQLTFYHYFSFIVHADQAFPLLNSISEYVFLWSRFVTHIAGFSWFRDIPSIAGSKWIKPFMTSSRWLITSPAGSTNCFQAKNKRRRTRDCLDTLCILPVTLSLALPSSWLQYNFLRQSTCTLFRVLLQLVLEVV